MSLGATYGHGSEGRLSYPGWRVVLAMFLVTMFVFGVTVYGFIIIGQPMALEHRWSAAQSGSLVSAMWMIAPLALLCAPLIQKFGPWRLLLAGLIFEAAAFAAITIVGEFWQLYLLRLAMGVGKVFAVVSMPVIVARWFSTRFGLAIAIAWCGGAFGGLVLSPVVELMMTAVGWRHAALLLSLSVLIVAAIVAALGRSVASHAEASALAAGEGGAASPKIGWQDIRKIDFMTAGVMGFAVLASGIATLGFSIQAPVLMETYGFSSTVAATILGLTAAGGMVGSLLAGWALDRFRSAWTSLAIGGALAVSLAFFYLLGVVPSLGLAVTAALLIGLGLGGCEILWITLTKRQFGARLFAVTYGGWSFFYSLGYAMAGGIGGTVYENMGGAIFLLMITLFCIPPIAFSLWRPGMQNEESPE